MRLERSGSQGVVRGPNREGTEPKEESKKQRDQRGAGDNTDQSGDTKKITEKDRYQWNGKKDVAVPTKWEDSDPCYIMNSQEVKLRSFTTSVSYHYPME